MKILMHNISKIIGLFLKYLDCNQASAGAGDDRKRHQAVGEYQSRDQQCRGESPCEGYQVSLIPGCHMVCQQKERK